MNQVNPLHIGGLLAIIILFLFFKLAGVKEEIKESLSDYKESEKLAVDLSGLKDVYANKKKSQKALKRILAQGSLRLAKIDVKYSKKFAKISAKSINTRELNSLMGKILNGSYNITLLKIKKLSETKASLTMEIQW